MNCALINVSYLTWNKTLLIEFCIFFTFLFQMSTHVFTIFYANPYFKSALAFFFRYNILTHHSHSSVCVICIKLVIYFCHYFDVLIACNYAYFINVQLSYDVFPRCCKILFLTWINEVIVKDIIVCWFYLIIYYAINFKRASFPDLQIPFVPTSIYPFICKQLSHYRLL